MSEAILSEDRTMPNLFKPVVDRKATRGSGYCGPTAISLLTGVPLSRIEQMIRRKRGGFKDVDGRKIAVRGTHNWEVKDVLKKLGCRVELIDEKKVKGKTLNVVVKECLPPVGTFLVNVTGHYMVACEGKIADTSHHEPIAIDDYKRKTRRVERVWKVIAPATPKWTVERDEEIAERKAGRRAMRAAAKPPVQVARLQEVERKIKVWERKAKLAKTKLTKLYASRRRYEKLGVTASK